MENRLIPYEAMKSLGKGAVLVLAPHPDDEVFGCGGAILRHLEAGDAVQVIIVTDGGCLDDDVNHNYICQRQRESIDAARILGYGKPLFWGIQDRELQYGESLVCRLVSTIEEYRAEWVYAPSILEAHPDHRALGMSAVEAVRRLGPGITLAMYEIGIPLPPNRLLDITDLRNTKSRAMACFTSQLLRQAYHRHVEALNCFRTYTLPREVEAAEAYWVIDGAQLREDFLGVYASEAERQYRLQVPINAFDQPLVSVLVRTIGRWELKEALNSIALQTYPRIEVVVVDARGNNELGLEPWCGRFPLQVCTEGRPLARSVAANLALSKAGGDYLIFLDDDDWFEPNHIADLAATLSKATNCFAVYAGVHSWKKGEDDSPRQEIMFNEPYDPLRLMCENYIPIHAVLFKKEILEKGCRFDETLDVYEDWDFWLQVSSVSNLLHLNQVSAYYRDSGMSNVGGIRHDSALVQRTRVMVFEKWKKSWSGEQLHKLLSSFLNQKTVNAALRKEIDVARELIKERDLRLSDVEGRLTERNQKLIEKNQRLTEQDRQLTEQDRQLTEQNRHLGKQKRQLTRLQMQLAEHKEAIGHYDKTIVLIYNSRSWKMTRPVRWLGWQARRVRNRLRRQKVNDKGTRKKNTTTGVGTSQIMYNVESFHILKSNFSQAKILIVSGWCLSLNGEKNPINLELKINQKVIKNIVCNGIREDVVSSIGVSEQDKLKLLYSGFNETIYLESHTTEITLYDPRGNFILIHARAEDIIIGKEDGENHAVGTEKKSNIILFTRHLLQRAKGKVQVKDLFSTHKWRYWYQKSKQEFQHFNLEREWMAEAGFGEQLTPYQAYTKNNQIRPHIRALLTRAAKEFNYRPLISILMPVYNVDPKWLTMAIGSVREQLYPDWELCIADDASNREETRQALSRYQDDARIKIFFREKNGHICKASNTAAEQAEGEFIVLMDQDDLLPPNALFEIVRLLQLHPEADLIYSDEDKIDGEGNRYDPYFKPDWSPTLMLGYNYINHLTCIRRSLFETVGRFREGYEGAQDYDLLLRIIEKTSHIFHLSMVLYHWRAIPESTASAADIKPIVKLAADAALKDYLNRNGIQAEIYQPVFAAEHRLPINQLDQLNLEDGPSVDIIIPTYNQHRLLKRCIDSLNTTNYKNYRILVVDNESDDTGTLAYLQNLRKQGIQVVRIPDAGDSFSFGQIMNDAVKSSTAELVLFLNNDTEILEPRWLSRMICYFQLPGVGVTGARLLYPDSTLQHAGVLLGMGKDGAPGYAFYRQPAKQLSYFFLADTARECSAITGACMLTSRQLFIENSGFDENHYPISLNDVDYCLRLQDKGLRSVYVPEAKLLHHESLTRKKEDDPKELVQFKKTYNKRLDSYYNSNLSKNGSFTVDAQCTLDYWEYLGRPLKVMFYSHNLNFEGAPSVIINLARGLKDRGKIAPILVSPEDGPARPLVEEEAIPCHVLRPAGIENILHGWSTARELQETIEQVCAFLEQEQPDVVVANVLNCFFVVEAAYRLNIPSLWLIHESYDRVQMLRHIHSPAMSLCEQAFQQAYGVVFVSRETCELYRRYNKNRNFTVVYNALQKKVIKATQKFEEKESSYRFLRIPQGKKVILTVGTVCERKDQETLVKAIALLAVRRDDFYCFIVGARTSIPYLDHVKRLIKKMDVSDKIRLVPETSEVHRYYQTADIFAFTSLNESYSLTILEAMAFALPIVTTPCYGVAEQVRFNINALGFAFRNAKELAERLESLLDDEDKRHRMGINSREMLQYMQDFDGMLVQYEKLIAGAWHVGDAPLKPPLAQWPLPEKSLEGTATALNRALSEQASTL